MEYKVNDYTKLKIWQKSVDLAVMVYQTTQDFPRAEMFGLVSQARRSAVSIASNIAEGAGRKSKKDFGYFLSIANGSTCELVTQLEIANRVNLLNDVTFLKMKGQITEIQKMNRSLKTFLAREQGPTKD